MKFSYQFKSIKTRLMVIVTALVIVICTGFGIASYSVADSALKGSIDQVLSKTSEGTAKIVEERVKSYLSGIHVLLNNESNILIDVNQSRNKIIPILADFAEKNGYLYAYVADKNGVGYTSTNVNVNISDRDYFKKAMAGNDIASDPLVSKATNKMEVFFVIPIKINNEIVGIIGATRDGNELSNIIADIKVGKTGNAFMINSKGTAIGNANKDLVLKMYNILKTLNPIPYWSLLQNCKRK